MSTVLLSPSRAARAAGLRPALRPLAASLLARLPMAALGLVLLLHTRALGDSLTVGGAVLAAFGLGFAAGGPGLGRLADRRGGARVLVAATAASVLALGALAGLPRGTPAPVLTALAAVAGLVHPPVGGIIRSAWPRLLAPDAVTRVYALESSALELTFIAGPALLGGMLGGYSTRLALAACAALLLAGTAALTTDRAVRVATRPQPEGRAARTSALRAPGVRVLTLAFAAFGTSLGAVEVAVAATARRPATAGVLLALWGLGSLLGAAALARGRTGSSSRDAGRRLVVLAAAWGMLHAGLAVAVPLGTVWLGAWLLVAGAVVAPCFATAYGLVGELAPEGTAAEAFSWLATGISVGAAAGSALAGVLAGGGAIPLAFAAAGLAPLGAAGLLWTRRRDLARGPAPVTPATGRAAARRRRPPGHPDPARAGEPSPPRRLRAVRR